MRSSGSKKPFFSSNSKKNFWKRRPSEIRGYQSTLYVTDENGDYLRIDYNLKDNKIRIYIEDFEEGGNPYYLVIYNGRITAQRNVSTGRSYDVVSKLNKKENIFSTISNKEISEIIYTVLGFALKQDKQKESEEERKKRIDETRKRYFRQDETNTEFSNIEQGTSKRDIFFHFIDGIIGILICVGLFIYYNSYIISGMVAALFGILIGMFDVFWRNRPPSFIKMLFFIITGISVYIYGYYIF